MEGRQAGWGRGQGQRAKKPSRWDVHTSGVGPAAVGCPDERRKRGAVRLGFERSLTLVQEGKRIKDKGKKNKEKLWKRGHPKERPDMGDYRKQVGGEGRTQKQQSNGWGGQNTRQPFTQGNEQEKVKTKAEKGN